VTTGYLTADDLAQRYHITKRAVYKWRVLGKGPRATRIEGKLLYALTDVEDYERRAREAA